MIEFSFIFIKCLAAFLTLGGVVFWKDFERYIGKSLTVILLIFTSLLTISGVSGFTLKEILSGVTKVVEARLLHQQPPLSASGQPSDTTVANTDASDQSVESENGDSKIRHRSGASFSELSNMAPKQRPPFEIARKLTSRSPTHQRTKASNYSEPNESKNDDAYLSALKKWSMVKLTPENLSQLPVAVLGDGSNSVAEAEAKKITALLEGKKFNLKVVNKSNAALFVNIFDAKADPSPFFTGTPNWRRRAEVKIDVMWLDGKTVISESVRGNGEDDSDDIAYEKSLDDVAAKSAVFIYDTLIK